MRRLSISGSQSLEQMDHRSRAGSRAVKAPELCPSNNPIGLMSTVEEDEDEDEDGDGVPTETVHKKGWLSKEGSKGVSIGFIHNWQRRFIDLNNGEFSYYTNDDMFEFKGSIILDKDSSVTYLKPDDARRMPNDKSIGQYFFCVHAKEGKVQRVSADTERERREWMVAIDNAIK